MKEKLYLQLSSGRGPKECSWVVAQLLEKIERVAKTENCSVELLSVTLDGNDGCKSALLLLEGELGWLNDWTGTIQWKGTSPYRPKHKRKNWFVSAISFPVAEESNRDSKEIRFETMRASGPGGQHVNKSETAVRLTHIPTGISVTAMEERSQHRNKQLAMAKLANILNNQKKSDQAQLSQDFWGQHDQLERGNPVKIFEGRNFKEIK